MTRCEVLLRHLARSLKRLVGTVEEFTLIMVPAMSGIQTQVFMVARSALYHYQIVWQREVPVLHN